MTLVRPRLNDYHGLLVRQVDLDFAVPYLDEDIPLYLDPFLLWKSPSLQDNSLHTAVVNSFNNLGMRYLAGEVDQAVETLVFVSECDEVGLGQSARRRGTRMSTDLARSVLSLFTDIPKLSNAGFTHFEEIQLLVKNVGADRVSDIACTFLKSFLIDYTIEQSEKVGIPRTKVQLPAVYDYQSNSLRPEAVSVPTSPNDDRPILLVPRRWLRRTPWINEVDFRKSEFLEASAESVDSKVRVPVLMYNRQQYGVIQAFTRNQERRKDECSNDELFNPISIMSAKRKLRELRKLPTGKSNNADRRFEELACQLLTSLLYPDMDFAQEQVRTDSGTLIRDLVFYNNREWDFLRDIHEDYGARQVVMELKNVRVVERQHVNQLNRYLGGHIGLFGVLVTRNPLPKAILRNTIDLWSGQRRCIVSLTDEDLSIMVSVFSSGNRRPIEVLKKKYIEFTRACPA